MPDIPVDREQDGLGVAFCCVESLMCDPADREGVLSWLSLLSGGVSNFMRETVRARLREAYDTGGTVAALVFINYLRLRIHQPGLGSIRKAQFLTAAALAADHVPVAASLKPVQRSWAKFQPVAHFWASSYLLGRSYPPRDLAEEEASHWIELFIRGADYLLWRAEAVGLHFPDPWRLPHAPQFRSEEREILGPLESWEINVLSDYRKKRRR